jgi:hypothetical protein
LKLRERGFAVSNERHGFKSVEYYEELRARCEVEIALAWGGAGGMAEVGMMVC